PPIVCIRSTIQRPPLSAFTSVTHFEWHLESAVLCREAAMLHLTKKEPPGGAAVERLDLRQVGYCRRNFILTFRAELPPSGSSEMPLRSPLPVVALNLNGPATLRTTRLVVSSLRV